MKLKYSKQTILNAVMRDGMSLQTIPDKYRTQDVCLAVVKQNPEAYQFVPQNFKDYELSKAALTAKSVFDLSIFSLLPEEFKTIEFASYAVVQTHNSWKELPYHLKTKVGAFAFLENHPKQYNLIKDFIIQNLLTDKSLILEVIKYVPQMAPEILKHLPEKLVFEELCLVAVAQDPNFYKLVPEALKTYDVSKVALISKSQSSNPIAHPQSVVFPLLPEKFKTIEFARYAVIQTRKAWYDLPDNLKTDELAITFLENYHLHYWCIEDVINTKLILNRPLFLKALNLAPQIIRSIPEDKIETEYISTATSQDFDTWFLIPQECLKYEVFDDKCRELFLNYLGYVIDEFNKSKGFRYIDPFFRFFSEFKYGTNELIKQLILDTLKFQDFSIPTSVISTFLSNLSALEKNNDLYKKLVMNNVLALKLMPNKFNIIKSLMLESAPLPLRFHEVSKFNEFKKSLISAFELKAVNCTDEDKKILKTFEEKFLSTHYTIELDGIRYKDDIDYYQYITSKVSPNNYRLKPNDLEESTDLRYLSAPILNQEGIKRFNGVINKSRQDFELRSDNLLRRKKIYIKEALEKEFCALKTGDIFYHSDKIYYSFIIFYNSSKFKYTNNNNSKFTELLNKDLGNDKLLDEFTKLHNEFDNNIFRLIFSYLNQSDIVKSFISTTKKDKQLFFKNVTLIIPKNYTAEILAQINTKLYKTEIKDNFIKISDQPFAKVDLHRNKVGKDWRELKNVPKSERTLELCKDAFLQDPATIKHVIINEFRDELLKEAIKNI